MKNILIAAGRKIRSFLASGKHGTIRHEERSVGTGAPDSQEIPGEPLPKDQTSTDGDPLLKSEKIKQKKEFTSQVEKEQGAAGRQPAWSLDDFDVVPMPGKSRFHDFDIPLPVMHAIGDLGFQYCTPIQEKSLPLVLSGRDLVGKANTGTGKTAVFLAAILSRILAENSDEQPKGKKGRKSVKALILAPTRELVMQIANDGKQLAKYCDVSINPVFGGADYQQQFDALRYGKCDIVVATPGRLLDFIGKQAVSFGDCRMLVLDEADRMLDMGFIPDVRRIVGRLPEAGARQTMMFSATVPGDVQRLAHQWCVKPEIVEAESEQVSVDVIDQIFYLATAEEKYLILLNLIVSHPKDRIIVFSNMKNETRRLAERLQRDGIDCMLLSGDVAQNKRVNRLERFRAGQTKVLVATDVAGRGIHIDDITMVVNYMLPYEPEDYVHRIGRTGRAGAQGKAVSFACEQGSFYLPAIEEFIGRKIECIVPDESLVEKPVINKRSSQDRSGETSSPKTARKRPRSRRPNRRRKPLASGQKSAPSEGNSQ